MKKSMHPPVFGIIWVAAVLLLSGCLYSPKLPPLAVKTPATTPVLIKGVNVFDGDPDLPVRSNQDILVRGDRIARIGPDLTPPDICQVIEAQGMSAIPGLIDMHTHIIASGAPPWQAVYPSAAVTDRNLSAFLYSGVTTVLDMGSLVPEIEETARRIKARGTINPRLFYVGKMIAKKGGHPEYMLRDMMPWPFSAVAAAKFVAGIETAGQIPAVIDRNIDAGACLTKIVIDQLPLGIPSLYEKLAAAAVTYSNRRGLTTAVHIGSEADILTGLAAGATLFAHIPYRSGISDSTLAAMQRQNAVVIPTLVVFENTTGLYLREQPFTAMDWAIMDPVLLNAYQHPPEASLALDDPRFAAWFHDLAAYRRIRFENVRKLKAAGIRLPAGTDSPNLATVPGSSLHTELRLLVENCGFTAKEALAAATSVAGELLHQWTGKKGLGRLTEGGPADLLIIDGDVFTDIRQTRNLYRVMAGGRFVEPGASSSPNMASAMDRRPGG